MAAPLSVCSFKISPVPCIGREGEVDVSHPAAETSLPSSFTWVTAPRKRPWRVVTTLAYDPTGVRSPDSAHSDPGGEGGGETDADTARADLVMGDASEKNWDEDRGWGGGGGGGGGGDGKESGARRRHSSSSSTSAALHVERAPSELGGSTTSYIFCFACGSILSGTPDFCVACDLPVILVVPTTPRSAPDARQVPD